MVGHSCAIPMLLIVILFLATGSSSAPLEDAQFLRQIANQYSPPLVISFLHSRMNFNQQMIKKIENSLTSLDESKRDVFELARKTLQGLDNQLITLENADYFDYNGTDKVKYFVEQFIMIDQFYPIEFGSSGMVNVGLTVDGILEQLKILTFDKLFNQTKTLIENYLDDVEDKESSVNYNHLQKLSASLTRTELQSLIDQLYVIKENPNRYNYNDVNDPRRNELDKVLRKLEITTDFFYSQFNHLADPNRSNTNKPTNGHQSTLETTSIYRSNDDFDLQSEIVTGPTRFKELNLS